MAKQKTTIFDTMSEEQQCKMVALRDGLPKEHPKGMFFKESIEDLIKRNKRRFEKYGTTLPKNSQFKIIS